MTQAKRDPSRPKPGTYVVVYNDKGESMRCHVDDIPGGWDRTSPEEKKREAESKKAEKNGKKEEKDKK